MNFSHRNDFIIYNYNLFNFRMKLQEINIFQSVKKAHIRKIKQIIRNILEKAIAPFS